MKAFDYGYTIIWLTMCPKLLYRYTITLFCYDNLITGDSTKIRLSSECGKIICYQHNNNLSISSTALLRGNLLKWIVFVNS